MFIIIGSYSFKNSLFATFSSKVEKKLTETISFAQNSINDKLEVIKEIQETISSLEKSMNDEDANELIVNLKDNII